MNRKVSRKQAILATGDRSVFNRLIFFFLPSNGVSELLHLQLNLVHINIFCINLKTQELCTNRGYWRVWL